MNRESSEPTEVRPYRAPEVTLPNRPSGPLARKSPGAEPTADPTVRVIRENGVVERIEVECGCGRKIELHCKYDEPGDSGAGTKETPTCDPSSPSS